MLMSLLDILTSQQNNDLIHNHVLYEIGNHEGIAMYHLRICRNRLFLFVIPFRHNSLQLPHYIVQSNEAY